MAFDAFLELKHGGKSVCEGEALDEKFRAKGAMQLTSFTLQSNVDLSTEPTAPPAADQKFFTLKLKKDVDTASPDLFRAYCLHATKAAPDNSFASAILTVRKAAGAEQMAYLVMDLANVSIQSYKLDCTDGDSEPEESFDLVFGALMISYYAQKSGGGAAPVKLGGWDFGEHIPCHLPKNT